MYKQFVHQANEMNVSKVGSWFQTHPALTAALSWWLYFLFLSVVTLFTGWASRSMTLFLQLFASLGAGIQAAWLYQRSQIAGDQHIRQGALAGFYLPLASAFVIMIIAIFAVIGSSGIVISLMVPYFLFLPIEIGGCSLAGALGAWIYKKIFVC